MMSNHDDEEIILTGHVRSDIIILSSLLNGQQAARSSVLRDKANEDLALLAYISTILTIGGDSSPLAESVHAVTGKITPNALECLVCAENVEQSPEKHAQPAVPESGTLEQIEEVGNSGHGAELLQRWREDASEDANEDTSNKRINKRNYCLKDHLRDVFQILAYLRNCNQNDPAFYLFNCLIHRRAFRKLGWRIDKFLTGWGESPFAVLQRLNFTMMDASKTFKMRFSENEILVMELHFPADLYENNKFRVDADNISQWLNVFEDIFQPLRAIFSSPRIYMRIPSAEEVTVAITYIGLLVKIKPIIQFIVSLPGVDATLLEAETWQRVKKRTKKSGGNAHDLLKNFSLPPGFEHLQKQRREEDVVNVPASTDTQTTLVDMTGKDENDQAGEEEEDEDEPDDLSDLITEDSASKTRTATGRFLLSMYAIAAWYVSVSSIAKRIHKFNGMEMKVHFYELSNVPQTKNNLALRDKLDKLILNLGLSTNQKKYGVICSHWTKAKVHAEAALMGWAYGQRQAGETEFVTDDVAIAVSKKCCFLCWLLHKKLNKKGVVRFSLPDTHNGIFAWIPPREVPEDILLELRDELLAILRDVEHSHSRQSSAVSSSSEDFPFNEVLGSEIMTSHKAERLADINSVD